MREKASSLKYYQIFTDNLKGFHFEKPQIHCRNIWCSYACPCALLPTGTGHRQAAYKH